MPVRPNLTNRKIQEVIIETEDPASTKEETEDSIKILDSIYKRINFDKFAASTTDKNFEERKLLLGLLNEFEDLFNDTMVKWYT